MAGTAMEHEDGKALARRAVRGAFARMSPREQRKNPVMLIVCLCAVLTLALFAFSLLGIPDSQPGFILVVSLVLWATVLFSKFAEALAEGRGDRQEETLRSAAHDVDVHKLNEGLVARGAHVDDPATFFHLRADEVDAAALKKKDLFFVAAGDQIPADGEIVRGVATVDESAVTGESAPVIRESGSEHPFVTGGTMVLSDWLVVRVTADAGTSFLDRMLVLVESASRKKAPDERALEVLVALLMVVFVVVVASLLTSGGFRAGQLGEGDLAAWASLVALFVCLAPTTVGALVPAVGIAGMHRLSEVNVLAKDGRAVEAAGDVDVLLLDKTGTVTLGNRQAVEFIPVKGATEREVASAALAASLSDDTPEGRSIVALARERWGEGDFMVDELAPIPFTARTLMSGAACGGRELWKGAPSAVMDYVESGGGVCGDACAQAVDRVARGGGTPVLVARDHRILGVVYLRDIVKRGMRESLADLRTLGIKTVMVTGDNPFAAAAVAAEAGIDDFIAGATPEKKVELIRRYQAENHVVAMAGDGLNDVPALAQADVAVVMGSGVQAAKEAGNLIDLDSSPTKLIDIVHIGKQLLGVRRNLTAFAIANDLAKYLVIVPSLLAPLYPQVGMLGILHLADPRSVIVSAVVYNAVVLVALIPLALRGMRHRDAPFRAHPSFALMAYGLGGAVLPFVAIKLLDVLMVLVGVA